MQNLLHCVLSANTLPQWVDTTSCQRGLSEHRQGSIQNVLGHLGPDCLMGRWLRPRPSDKARFSTLGFAQITPSEEAIWGVATQPRPLTAGAVSSCPQGVHTKCFEAICTCNIYFIVSCQQRNYLDRWTQPPVRT